MRIHVNDVDLFYTVSGNGPPLILLHGNGEDHHIFDPLAVKLKCCFTVYALDSRNHGQSEKTDVYSYVTMAEDVFAFVHALNLEKADFVGFSDGAIVTLLLALGHAQIIRRMALLGPNLKPEDFTEESYRYVKDTYERTKNPLFRMMLEQPNIEADDLKGVPVPSLVVGGEHDIYRPNVFENIAAALPNAELKILAGHDHDSYIVNRDLLFPDLLRFFK